jgi:hypothetical protein
VNNKEPDHDNCGPTSGRVRWPVILECAGDTSNDQVAACHSQGSYDEYGHSAKLIYVHDGWNSGLFRIVRNLLESNAVQTYKEHGNTNDTSHE